MQQPNEMHLHLSGMAGHGSNQVFSLLGLSYLQLCVSLLLHLVARCKVDFNHLWSLVACKSAHIRGMWTDSCVFAFSACKCRLPIYVSGGVKGFMNKPRLSVSVAAIMILHVKSEVSTGDPVDSALRQREDHTAPRNLETKRKTQVISPCPMN
jgi:hypothetical protein